MAGILDRLAGHAQPTRVDPGALAAAVAAARRKADPAAPAGPDGRTVRAEDYGLPTVQQLRTDLPVEDPALAAALAAARAGHWQPAAQLFWSVGQDWERRYVCTTVLASQAAQDDAWLRAWRQAHPQDAAAVTVQARSLVDLAWQIRSSNRAQDVSRDQWDGFFRMLNEVPALCREASALAPEDPTPWIVMLPTAMGLQWPNEDFTALWTEVVRRAPYHVKAHLAALSYWRPRWSGSVEHAVHFVETAIASAPRGSLLTLLRLDLLNSELRPDDQQQRPAFWTGDQVRWAVDEALADLAAADPGQLRVGALRSWLARILTLEGRHAEAFEQFRQLGSFIAFEPWSFSKDGTSLYLTTRTTAVLGWEDAGRPPLPPLPQPAAPPADSLFARYFQQI
jgi:hypothetical protein